MADSNRDRNGRYGGRGRDFEWDRDRDFGRGPDWPDYGGGTRWGSGDYRQNFGRERGASGNYGGGGGFGSGGGYGTARDYETAHYADTGYATPRQSY
ncbi:MAG TPA: hypothetical protein VHK90_17375, partial [Thermoanaerobaculia bacterium]|nr:hypothetical protein [Thermoanaerobaculia bacterium]